MEPFLPGEIPVLVLRFLAANKCEASAMTLIEEMPILKTCITPKPPKFSNSDYLKYLARSSVNPGLKDLLSDYMNSKMLVEEIFEGDVSFLPSNLSDSLHSKIKTLHEMLKVHASDQEKSIKMSESPKGATTNATSDLVKLVLKVDQSSITDEDYECPHCSARANPKSFIESSCQTDEVTAVQFGLQHEIPVIFYNTLLNDGDLQNKLAQTINEHIQDPSETDGSSRPDHVVKKLASKTETEIDKFLDVLLKDIDFTDDSNGVPNEFELPDGNEVAATGPTTFAEVERNMNIIFGESEMIEDGNQIQNNSATSDKATDSEPVKLLNTPDVEKKNELSSNPNENLNKSIQQGQSSMCPPIGNEDGVKTAADDSSSQPDSTPASGSRRSLIKRITPTRIPSSVNPVFKTSVVVEKQTVDFGDKRTKLSVIKKDIERPAWSKLGRKQIVPKIPGLVPASPAQPKVRVITKDATDQVLRLGDGRLRQGISASTSLSATKPQKGHEVEVGITAQSPNSTPGKTPPSAVISPPTSSQKKRKATPVKLTPEKANSSDFHFMRYMCHENDDKLDLSKSFNETDVDKVDSILKRSPVPSGETSKGKLSLSQDESQPVVTPMQAPLPVDFSSSALKTISPNALRRFTTSTSKLPNTSSSIVNFINKKKSYSTPRKRRHVRSLTFATPPSLKARTPGKGLTQNSDQAKSCKRKATEDLLPTEFKSKKRLNWPESEKKCKTHVVDQSIMIDSSVTKKLEAMVSDDNVGGQLESSNLVSTHVKDKVTANPCSVPNMPTILEESISNISVNISVNEESKPVDDKDPVQPVTSNPEVSTTDQNQDGGPKVTLYALPNVMPDGTTYMQYYQLSNDMQTLIPVNLIPFPEQGLKTPQPETLFLPPPVTINPDGTVNTFVPAEQAQVAPILPPLPANPILPLAAENLPPLSSPMPETPVAPNQKQQSLTPIELLNQANALETPPQIPPSTVIQKDSVKCAPPPAELLSPISSAINSVALGKYSPKTKSTSESSDKKASIFDLSISSSSNENTPNPPTKAISKSTLESRRRSARKSVTEVVGVVNSLPSPAKGKDTKPTTTAEEAKRLTRSRSKAKQTSSNSSKPKGPQQQSQQFSLEVPCAELDKPSRSRKGQGKGKAPKKPKVTMNVLKNLFGDTPVKQPTSRDNMEGKQAEQRINSGTNKDRKLPVDVIAAQTVAAEAVPLGSPRKSPRKHPVKSLPVPVSKPVMEPVPPCEDAVNQVLPIPVIKTVSPTLPTINKSFPSSSALSNESQHPPDPNQILPTPQKNVTFNIVPAPLGFPEPTPVKNFVETGFLNISDVGFPCNGPLITPLKTIPPPTTLNETQFTLPPTPRMIEDPDSNSNSTHSINFMSMNWFTSTPLKCGVPRTPGRGSPTSSNSHSPLRLEKIQAQKVQLEVVKGVAHLKSQSHLQPSSTLTVGQQLPRLQTLAMPMPNNSHSSVVVQMPDQKACLEMQNIPQPKSLPQQPPSSAAIPLPPNRQESHVQVSTVTASHSQTPVLPVAETTESANDQFKIKHVLLSKSQPLPISTMCQAKSVTETTTVAKSSKETGPQKEDVTSKSSSSRKRKKYQSSKSEGELSSSDEDESQQQKPVRMVVPSKPQAQIPKLVLPPKKSPALTILSSPSQNNGPSVPPMAAQVPYTTAKPLHPSPVSHPSLITVPLKSDSTSEPKIGFQVSGRKKILTLSETKGTFEVTGRDRTPLEKETAYSLIDLKNLDSLTRSNSNKVNPSPHPHPQKPVETAIVHPQKPNNDDEPRKSPSSNEVVKIKNNICIDALYRVALKHRSKIVDEGLH